MGFMSGVGVEHCRETVGHLWYPHVAERGRRPKKNGRGRMWWSEGGKYTGHIPAHIIRDQQYFPPHGCGGNEWTG